jgi:molybdate transport system regulatory protein
MPSKDKGRIVPRFRVMHGKEIALGPGKVALLRHLQKTGSILEAARRMEMSYMRAWKLIRTMNACFRDPLVIAERGGKTRGGARLTQAGEAALSLYGEMEERSLQVNQRSAGKLIRMLKRGRDTLGGKKRLGG